MDENGAPGIELLQFKYSPYNEKVRWALDLKGLHHRRTSLLPGPHMVTIKRLTGQTQTPVLRLGDGIHFGSARILDRLEKSFPDPSLMPTEPDARARVLEIQQKFDDDLTPRMRRASLAAALTDLGYVTRMFAGDASTPTRLFYRTTLPVAQGMIRKGNGIRDERDIEDGAEATAEALDFVARAGAATGYLVGERFTIADLTAAASLAVVANPNHVDMRRPEPMPPAVADWLAAWSNHPGAAWTREMYRRHRPEPLD